MHTSVCERLRLKLTCDPALKGIEQAGAGPPKKARKMSPPVLEGLEVKSPPLISESSSSSLSSAVYRTAARSAFMRTPKASMYNNRKPGVVSSTASNSSAPSTSMADVQRPPLISRRPPVQSPCGPMLTANKPNSMSFGAAELRRLAGSRTRARSLSLELPGPEFATVSGSPPDIKPIVVKTEDD